MLTTCTLWLLALSDGSGYLALPDAEGERAAIVREVRDATTAPHPAYFYDTESLWPDDGSEVVVRCADREGR